uniref:Uncharacterized protein n=1 Tax=Anguilla anguilla TaxID=7936 RepID=A0A0E9SZL3_ANGAN
MSSYLTMLFCLKQCIAVMPNCCKLVFTLI